MGTYSELIQASSPPAPLKEMGKDAGSKKRSNERSNVRTNDGLKKSSQNKKSDPDRKQPSNRDTMQPRNHDTVVSRYHDTTIETVRKSVKAIGKEAATHRFTIEEKRAIADLVYAHKRRGIRTSENEITRIAVNFVLQDNQESGKNGVLDKVLKALNT
jgi:hypothetical protein